MGSDKAYLQLAGRSLLAHALDLARAVTPDLRFVADPETFVGFATVVPDLYPARGPLGGIHAALSNSATDLNLILAVDLPFLEPRFLHYLLAEAQSAAATVTVPSAAANLHPLCAMYRKQFVVIAERALAE